jgi:hypothetical protein
MAGLPSPGMEGKKLAVAVRHFQFAPALARRSRTAFNDWLTSLGRSDVVP